MSDFVKNGDSAANSILLLGSGSQDDGQAYFNACTPENVGYYVARDGMVYTRDVHNKDGIVRIMLANVGPVLLSRGRAYPMRYDRNGMPEADTDKPPVWLFYEFCQFDKFRGCQHFESYTAHQLESLGMLLRRLTADTATPYTLRLSSKSNEQFSSGLPGVYLQSLVDSATRIPHPQQDLVKIFKSVDR